MHELSVCQALLTQVEAIAVQEQAKCVTAIQVRIGPLSGVVPDLLEQAFPLVSAGSIAEQACLRLEQSGVRVRCQHCGKESDVQPNRLLCSHCGDYHTQLISGDELLLVSVELERDQPAN